MVLDVFFTLFVVSNGFSLRPGRTVHFIQENMSTSRTC